MSTFVIIACWILIVWFGWGACLVVLNIGKPRTPTTPGVALFSLVFVGLLIFCLSYSALNL